MLGLVPVGTVAPVSALGWVSEAYLTSAGMPLFQGRRECEWYLEKASGRFHLRRSGGQCDSEHHRGKHTPLICCEPEIAVGTLIFLFIVRSMTPVGLPITISVVVRYRQTFLLP